MIVFGFKKHEIFFETMKICDFFLKIYGENCRSRSRSRNFLQAGAGAGAEIFDKLESEPEPHKN
jgi:hypothetical protein